MTESADNVRDLRDEEPEEEAVDLDLDEIDEQLRREAIGQSTTVRIHGETIHISHAGEWSQTAMRAATMGDWETWARESIIDDDEFRTWQDADLHNYQIEAIFDACGKAARMNMGKSRRRSGSRQRTPKKSRRT